MIRLYNESKLPTAEVNRLTHFVTSRCSFASKTRIVVHEKFEDGWSYGGIWYANGIEASFPDLVAPSLVQIWMNEDLQYPYLDEHIPDIGAVKLRNWREHYLFILAHELRHNDQFHTEEACPLDIEVDAELFAFRMLREYRKLEPRAAQRLAA